MAVEFAIADAILHSPPRPLSDVAGPERLKAVILRLDTPGGDELMAKLGSQDANGLPFFAFLDSGGKLIANSLRPAPGKNQGENIGHPVAPEEVDWFLVMLHKAVPTLTPGESAAVETYLRHQKVN